MDAVDRFINNELQYIAAAIAKLLNGAAGVPMLKRIAQSPEGPDPDGGMDPIYRGVTRHLACRPFRDLDGAKRLAAGSATYDVPTSILLQAIDPNAEVAREKLAQLVRELPGNAPLDTILGNADRRAEVFAKLGYNLPIVPLVRYYKDIGQSMLPTEGPEQRTQQRRLDYFVSMLCRVLVNRQANIKRAKEAS